MKINDDLSKFGLMPNKILHNLDTERLIEESLRRQEGLIAKNGALVVRTGERTGRSPDNRFIVSDDLTQKNINWGKINRAIDRDIFNEILATVAKLISNQDLFVFDGFVGNDPQYRMPLRVVTTHAWHSLFARTLFVRPDASELQGFTPEFQVINAFGKSCDLKKFGLDSSTLIAIDFTKRLILIIGTGYGGEMKKGIFSVMNYLLPSKNVFPMHCSANMGCDGDTALFFGLSGTGKTTLSADPKRRLIGDDEHGWSDQGIFNFEGGCYAKVINLSKEAEPQIFTAIRRGSILENVIIDENGDINFAANMITENTRGTYPLDFIDNAIKEGIGSHPKNIFFLTCDAFGVLPPISKLNSEQAMYHFISGYTAKVAGTEVGITEPKATFSSCFGSPFLPLSPKLYAKMLKERLERHGTNLWLVNTGWSGGGYGVGKRMSINLTRSLLNFALDGKLDIAEFTVDPIFNLCFPKSCESLTEEILNPIHSWKDKEKYKSEAMKLKKLFDENYKKISG